MRTGESAGETDRETERTRGSFESAKHGAIFPESCVGLKSSVIGRVSHMVGMDDGAGIRDATISCSDEVPSFDELF